MRKQVGKYRLLKKLGEGGMGTVYAAEDGELGRQVALKMLHESDRVARGRMWREARAAAAINHPNVCQVFEVGEENGELFLAMELLNGESLAERMERAKLAPGDALAIAQRILSALDALHARGFVHRDLKPSNVFLTAQGVKLLDFGLALPVIDDDMRLTKTGVLVGTPAFMAPEQWEGEPVGPASDLFAVGALVFEMFAGEPAFKGSTPVEVYHAIVHRQPPALVGGPWIAAVDRVLQRALAKAPRDRYSSAARMAADLAATSRHADTGETPRARTITRLVTLPFQLLHPDTQTEFLSFGLPDAIAASLARLESIVVRMSQQVPDDVTTIAREANVDFVLTGRIQRAGERIRVTAQLLRADASVAWSESVDAEVDDIFRLQDDLAHRIVASLSIPLSADEERGLRGARAATADAYRYYLRANQLANNSGMLEAARDLYRECLDKDPGFAPAWARLGRTYRVLAKYGHGDPAAGYRLAEEAFRKALELDPDLSTAHFLFTYFQIEQLVEAPQAMVRLLRQASRYPSDPELFSGLVAACRFCGLLEASVAADHRARRLDPGIRTSVAYTYFAMCEYEEAIRHDDEDMRYMLMDCLPMLGKGDECLALCRELVRARRSGFERSFVDCKLAMLEGDRERCLAAAMAIYGSRFDDPEGLYQIARDVVRVGALDEALEMLENVVDRGLHIVSTYERDPWLDPLRERPEFAKLVARARAGREAAKADFLAAGGDALLMV